MAEGGEAPKGFLGSLDDSLTKGFEVLAGGEIPSVGKFTNQLLEEEGIGEVVEKIINSGEAGIDIFLSGAGLAVGALPGITGMAWRNRGDLAYKFEGSFLGKFGLNYDNMFSNKDPKDLSLKMSVAIEHGRRDVVDTVDLDFSYFLNEKVQEDIYKIMSDPSKPNKAAELLKIVDRFVVGSLAKSGRTEFLEALQGNKLNEQKMVFRKLSLAIANYLSRSDLFLNTPLDMFDINLRSGWDDEKSVAKSRNQIFDSSRKSYQTGKLSLNAIVPNGVKGKQELTGMLDGFEIDLSEFIDPSRDKDDQPKLKALRMMVGLDLEGKAFKAEEAVTLMQLLFSDQEGNGFWDKILGQMINYLASKGLSEVEAEEYFKSEGVWQIMESLRGGMFDLFSQQLIDPEGKILEERTKYLKKQYKDYEHVDIGRIKGFEDLLKWEDKKRKFEEKPKNFKGAEAVMMDPDLYEAIQDIFKVTNSWDKDKKKMKEDIQVAKTDVGRKSQWDKISKAMAAIDASEELKSEQNLKLKGEIQAAARKWYQKFLGEFVKSIESDIDDDLKEAMKILPGISSATGKDSDLIVALVRAWNRPVEGEGDTLPDEAMVQIKEKVPDKRFDKTDLKLREVMKVMLTLISERISDEKVAEFFLEFVDLGEFVVFEHQDMISRVDGAMEARRKVDQILEEINQVASTEALEKPEDMTKIDSWVEGLRENSKGIEQKQADLEEKIEELRQKVLPIYQFADKRGLSINQLKNSNSLASELNVSRNTVSKMVDEISDIDALLRSLMVYKQKDPNESKIKIPLNHILKGEIQIPNEIGEISSRLENLYKQNLHERNLEKERYRDRVEYVLDYLKSSGDKAVYPSGEEEFLFNLVRIKMDRAISRSEVDVNSLGLVSSDQETAMKLIHMMTAAKEDIEVQKIVNDLLSDIVRNLPTKNLPTGKDVFLRKATPEQELEVVAKYIYSLLRENLPILRAHFSEPEDIFIEP